GHLDLALEPVSLAAIISESCALVRPIAAQRNVRLDESEVARDCCYVWADRQRLKQVIINLLSNGIKYNRRGGQVSVSCDARPENRLRIAIRDTGQGLSAQERAKLFTPFERLKAADSGIAGTGLGLVLSRRLVMAMQGELEVESVEGQGSVFSIELPQASAQIEAPAAQSEGAPNFAAGPDTPAPGLYTVLCVEDNPANLQLLEVILLQRPEITMLSTSHGEAGLDLARQHDFDLILLDLNLPDIAGDEVLSRLQDDEKQGMCRSSSSAPTQRRRKSRGCWGPGPEII
ncbi:MAG TPA: ATP-binding protein, partial [Abditibacterium sp.]